MTCVMWCVCATRNVGSILLYSRMQHLQMGTQKYVLIKLLIEPTQVVMLVCVSKNKTETRTDIVIEMSESARKVQGGVYI